MKKHMKKSNQEVKKVAELVNINRNKPLKIIWDASKRGLDKVLQQCDYNKWKPTPYASRFSLTSLDGKTIHSQ